MHRFFVQLDSFGASRVRITGDTADQIRRVLRLRPGDPLTLLDGLGFEYRGTLEDIGKEDAWVQVGEKIAVATEARAKVTLYISLLNKPDKYEWVLQKCTELGADRFVPLVTERTVAERFSPSRRDRWARIVLEAAEQSGRGVIPSLAELMPIGEALASEERLLMGEQENCHFALMPEVGQQRSLHKVFAGLSSPPDSVSLFIGPEGGFTKSEVAQAEQSGVRPVTLGRRILRAETAAVAGLALVMAQLGEME